MAALAAVTMTAVIVAAFTRPAICQEIGQRELFLSPRNFNPHPTAGLTSADVLRKFIDSLRNTVKRKGPVLFPASPSPPTAKPLIVTARPLLPATTLPTTRYNLANRDNYVANNLVDDSYLYTDRNIYDRHPYGAITEKARIAEDDIRDHYYNTYEEQTIVPPIYKALGNYAHNKVLQQPSLKVNRVHAVDTNYLGNGARDYDYYDEGIKDKHYAFSYTVKDDKTGDDFSHSQRHTGQATAGEYRVRLPDGRMQIVSYTADDGGYKADVRYDDTPTDDINQNTIENVPQYPVRTYKQSIENIQYKTAENSAKLGRIVVPEEEEYIYQSTPQPIYNRYTQQNSPVYYYTTSGAILENGVSPTAIYQDRVSPTAIYQDSGHSTVAPELVYQQIASPEVEPIRQRANMYTTVAPYIERGTETGGQYYVDINKYLIGKK